MLDNFKKDQPEFCELIESSLKNNKLSHAYFIETNGYNKSEELVMSFVKSILCRNHDQNIKKDGYCYTCNLIDTGNYLDLRVIKPENGVIKTEVIDDLINDYQSKPDGEYKVYVIFDFDLLTRETPNKILKFLEEPNEDVIGVLVASNKYKILSTIISRCLVFSLKNTNKKIVVDEYFDSALNILNLLDDKDDKAVAYIQDVLDLKNTDRNGIKLIFNNILNLLDVIISYKSIDNYSLKNYNNIDNIVEKISNNNSLETLINRAVLTNSYYNKLQYNPNINLVFYSYIIDYIDAGKE